MQYGKLEGKPGDENSVYIKNRWSRACLFYSCSSLDQCSEMAELSVSGLCKVLTDEKFDNDVVETCFRDNKIDGETFLELNEGDLKELGVQAFGDRRKLQKLQQRLKVNRKKVHFVIVIRCQNAVTFP